MAKILINYAHNAFYKSQIGNCESGKQYGFDIVMPYNFDMLDNSFKKRNAHILKQPRGAGYWIWKPQILLQTFQQCNEGDYVFYSDSGATFISGIDCLIPICDRNNGILLFHLTPDPKNCEQVQTKRDTFVLMGCEHVKDMWPPIHGGFQLYKNCFFAKYFVNKLLHYCEDERIVTDSPNQFGENYPLFQNHRHDQSILSCLQKKMGIQSYNDPSQYGNQFRKPEDGYGQLINHHRNPN